MVSGMNAVLGVPRKKKYEHKLLIESFSMFIYVFGFGYIRKIFKDNDSQIPFSTDFIFTFLIQID